MIRFDQYFTVLEENRIVKIDTDIELTEEYNLLKDNNFNISKNDLRIMVIGDSYIHGGGINFEDNFSQQLKKKLRAQELLSFKNIWVLDVSKPSSNTLDNNLTFFEYKDSFKPNILIFGYNFNDIEGNLNKDVQNLSEIKFNGEENDQSFISKLYSIVKKSRLIGFTMNKTHRWFNSYDIVFPGSKFDENLKTYTENRIPWKKSKKLLDEIIETSESDNIKLLVYKFQDMSINPSIMSDANNIINNYFKEYTNKITFIDGNDIFKSEDFKKYQLSRYDGHPNEKAHLKMANEISDVITNE